MGGKEGVVHYLPSTDLCCACCQTFKNPKPALLALLRESGPVPGDENGLKSKRGGTQDDGAKKKKRVDKNVRYSLRMHR